MHSDITSVGEYPNIFFYDALSLWHEMLKESQKKKSVEIQKLCSFALLAWSKKFQEHKKKRKKKLEFQRKIVFWFLFDSEETTGMSIWYR